jgi:hypothetical protein
MITMKQVEQYGRLVQAEIVSTVEIIRHVADDPTIDEADLRERLREAANLVEKFGVALEEHHEIMFRIGRHCRTLFVLLCVALVTLGVALYMPE